jgi:hypothetical protein
MGVDACLVSALRSHPWNFGKFVPSLLSATGVAQYPSGVVSDACYGRLDIRISLSMWSARMKSTQLNE